MATATLQPPLDLREIHTAFGAEGHRQDLVFQHGYWYTPDGRSAPTTREGCKRAGVFVPPEFEEYVLTGETMEIAMADGDVESLVDNIFDSIDLDDILTDLQPRQVRYAEPYPDDPTPAQKLKTFQSVPRSGLPAEWQQQEEPEYDIPAPMKAMMSAPNGSNTATLKAGNRGIRKQIQIVPGQQHRRVGR